MGAAVSTCEFCGKTVGNRWIGKHRAECLKRPGVEPPAPAPDSHAPRPRRRAGGTKAAKRVAQVVPRNGHGCETCPGHYLHGMSVGEVQVVEQAVMAGLSIEAASKIVRMAQAAK